MRVLAVGLSLALSYGVVSAQPAPAAPGAPAVPAKKAKPRPKKPPAEAKPPEAKPVLDVGPVKPADPAPAAKPTVGQPGAPNKTDEKAGVNETLTKDNQQHPWLIGVSPPQQAAANIAFREGNTQLNDGLFVNAVAKYREALKSWNHPAIHYNLALALLNLDQPIEVFEHLNEAVQYGAEPLEKDKFEHAKEYLLLVEKQLADIEVSCDKIGAKVSVDGKEVFIAPGKYSQKVRVGKHTFYADKEGYNARITAPYVGPGEKFRIELKLYTAEELTRYKRKWQNTWFPWAITGAGVVVGLAAGGLELSAQSSYDQFNTKVAACNTTSAGCANSTPGITKLRDSGDTKRMLGYVGYGVAGVAVATGLTLLWVNRSTPYQISAEELNATPQPPPLAVAPIVSPEVVGAAVQGHF
jgi:hypothetical protein